MFNGKKIIAIIPARGGSKRLQHKNIKVLGTKPLISWTIEAGLNSKYIDEVVVSSDSQDILNIAKKHGLDIPFVRPSSLALDTTSSVDVVLHTIKFYKESKHQEFDYIILLQPTSPFRSSIDIDLAVEYMFFKNADAVISVCKVEHNPIWSNTLREDLSMDNFLNKKYLNKRSQDLDDYYRLNGAIYLCKTDRVLEESTLFIKDNIFAYKMKQEDSIDIDTKLDFMLAEAILKGKNE